MIGIKNECLQGLELYIMTPNGPKTYWLEPNGVITLPSEYVSEQIKVLNSRRMVFLFNVY